MKRYGEYEQINGAVANSLMDEVDELTGLLEIALDGLKHAGLQTSIENRVKVESARVVIMERLK